MIPPSSGDKPSGAGVGEGGHNISSLQGGTLQHAHAFLLNNSCRLAFVSPAWRRDESRERLVGAGERLPRRRLPAASAVAHDAKASTRRRVELHASFVIVL